MTEDISKVLQSSQDPKELVDAAISLATSSQPPDHEALLSRLRSSEFLKRLDSDEEYKGPARLLRIARVLHALGQNQAVSAHRTLVALTQVPAFVEEASRADLLIKISAMIRPVPPELTRFWDAHCQPDDGFGHLTIEAVVENGTEEAMALLEKKMTDVKHSEDDKIAWMRTSILSHRNDLPLLQSCEQLLRGGLPETLRLALIEVLFDYRPTEWFSPATVLAPPERQTASVAALEQLREIGEWALRALKLTTGQKQAIEKTLLVIKALSSRRVP